MPTATSISLFDDAIFDSLIFDTKTQYELTIAEVRQLFDPALFDSAFFDDNPATAYVVSDDILTRTQGLKKTLSESMSQSDSGSNFANKTKRTISDAFSTLAETIQRVYNSKRIPSHTFTLSESVARQSPTTFRQIYEGYTFFDGSIFDSNLFDTVFNPITLTDNVIRTQNTKKVIIHGWDTLADSINRVFSAKRIPTYTWTLSESLSREIDTFRTLTETISRSESLVRVQKTVRTLADTITRSESITRVFGQIVSLAYSFTSSESLGVAGSMFRTLAETITRSEFMIGKKISFRTLAETITRSESLSLLSGRARHAIAYLTKRIGDIDFIIRANNSSITKRTANARTDEY